MKRIILLFAALAILAIPIASQTIEKGPASWYGSVKRGRTRVRAGGSDWSVNGVSVSHTEEMYDSSNMARYIFSRLTGKTRPASELVSNGGSVSLKLTRRKRSVRIAWVCETDLHYLESDSFPAAVALLQDWGLQSCN